MSQAWSGAWGEAGTVGLLVFGPVGEPGTGDDAWSSWHESPIPFLGAELALVRSRVQMSLQTFSPAAKCPCRDWPWVKPDVLVHPPFHTGKVQNSGAVYLNLVSLETKWRNAPALEIGPISLDPIAENDPIVDSLCQV